MHKVAITGIGIVSPVGNDTKTSWNAVINGRSGISKVDRFDTTPYSSHVGGFVVGEEGRLNSLLTPAKQRKTDRFMQLAILAADEAMRDSGLSRDFPLDRGEIGTYIGVGIGGLGVLGESALSLEKYGVRKISPFALTKAIMNEAPSWLAMEWDLQGPILSFCSACASGTDAIGMAYHSIRNGHSNYMVTGGTESCINDLSFASFGNMRALSTWSGDPKEASRPFDQDRSGFVMGEGAAILILERYDLAKARGANIYGEVVGYGSAADAYHITAIHPEGRGGALSIQRALKDATIDPSSVGYVNAHGTATPMNDPAETKILKKVFGESILANNPNHALISSTKSMTGHMLGGTGAVEAAFSVLALKDQVVPPTINLNSPDPECDLDYIPNTARDHKFDYAISNSFGFGGGNAVLAFKK